MKRAFLGSAGLVIIAATVALPSLPDHQSRAIFQRVLSAFLTPSPAFGAELEVMPWARALIDAGRGQIGETVIYDGGYVGLDYPMGDLPRERGVCTDVVIRALRDAHGIDLQQLVHEDMQRDFRAYPNNWGLSRTDRNIDHRRVPNLRSFFRRQGAALPLSSDPGAYQPGDLVTWLLPGNLPHIGIVSDRAVPGTNRPLIIHNVGAGTREEDVLFAYEITGQYRLQALGLGR
jgi:uncharacterized protein YijF (DUF1287 family)